MHQSCDIFAIRPSLVANHAHEEKRDSHDLHDPKARVGAGAHRSGACLHHGKQCVPARLRNMKVSSA